jgi:hypothetical protein
MNWHIFEMIRSAVFTLTSIAHHFSPKYGEPKTILTLEDSQNFKPFLTIADPMNLSLDSINQRIILTRYERQEIWPPIFSRVIQLANSLNLTFDSVEFVGGASPVPHFQDVVSGILGH